MRKKPPSALDTYAPNQPGMISFASTNERKEAFYSYGSALSRVEPIQRTSAALADQFKNVDSNMSVRAPFSRLDYEFFRPSEMVPRMQKQIISACMAAYDKISIVRNVMDTMSDFGSQGVRWYHPNAEIQEFYNSWFRKVQGPDRSERFLSLLYRSGNVLLKRSRGKLKEKNVNDFKRGIAAEHIDYTDDFADVSYREIPLCYTFLNPMTIEVVAEELSAFAGIFYYTMKLSPRLISMIQNPRDEYEIGMVNSLPDDIRVPVQRDGKRAIKISDNDLCVSYYKKDDWQVWANPMIYSMLDDLIAFEKMKLADLAALDGAISHIRIWKLGSLEHKLLPNDAAIQKLSDLLLNNVGGGSMDLIWGPDLELSETSTEIHKFLGSAKYETTLMNIYGGLGVPPTMTGAATNGGGFNNNFISLKTLTERLRYGRQKLNDFWEHESRMIQRAMRFKEPATLVFDHMNLCDEIAEKALWIQLNDRSVISDETLQERFGAITEIERKRLDREYGRRLKKKMPPKAGPYFDSEPDLSLAKIFAQRGAITPSETGLELDPRKPGEKTALDLQQEANKQKAKQDKNGVAGEGRPKNKKDSAPRKKKSMHISKATGEFVELSSWAEKAQKAIAEFTHPYFLHKYEKENMRQLTEAESRDVERFKSTFLFNLEPFSDISQSSLLNKLKNELPVYKQLEELTQQFTNSFVKSQGVMPNMDEQRRIDCYVYAMFKGDFEDGETGDNA